MLASSSPADSEQNSAPSSVNSNRADFSKNSFSDSGVLFTNDNTLSSLSAVETARLNHIRQIHSRSQPSFLISEREVPQKLLPLPFSVPAIPPEWDPAACSVDSGGSISSMMGTSPIRGSDEWAPPRFQIIWTLQPQKPVAQAAEKQKYRCAGCGHLVDKRVIKSLRYCHYFGRYFCTQCHTGQKSVLPATIIHNWDFNQVIFSD